MKWIRNSSYKAKDHVFGDNLLFVIIVLVAVGWFGDTLLELCHSLIDPLFPKTIYADFVVFVGAIAALLFIYFCAEAKKPSDNYKVSKEDPFKDNKKILIFTLSPYSDRGAASPSERKSIKDFERAIPDISSNPSIESISSSEFNCNWVPLLNTILNYPNLSEVIVITTNGPGGSHGQTATFRQFVDKYFSERGREFSIKSHIHSGYLEDPFLIGKNQDGAPSNELDVFAKTVLNLIDQIVDKNSNVKNIRKQVVVDVTGGTAAMSAVLGAVTSSKDLFLHYTDTNDMTSNEIDISSS